MARETASSMRFAPFAIAAGFMCWEMLQRYETQTAKSRIDIVGLVLLAVWLAPKPKSVSIASIILALTTNRILDLSKHNSQIAC